MYEKLKLLFFIKLLLKNSAEMVRYEYKIHTTFYFYTKFFSPKNCLNLVTDHIEWFFNYVYREYPFQIYQLQYVNPILFGPIQSNFRFATI